MSTSERIKFIDIYKGIGIILIIMGHIYFGETFNTYIHAFVLQMFPFISGFLFKQKEPKAFIYKKYKNLIMPYIKFGLFNFLACLILVSDFDKFSYFQNMFTFNNYNRLDITGTLWFLTFLFFLNIMFFFIIKYFKKFTFLICILLVGLIYFTKTKLPFSIDSAIYMLPMFYMGYIFKTISQKLSVLKNNVDIIIGLVILIIFSFVSFKNGYVNVRRNIYENIILFYINSVSLSIGYYYLSKFIEKYKFAKFLEYCGKYSLNFMCLNQLIIYTLDKYNVNNGFVILFITLFCLVIINELLNFIKNKFNIQII